MDVYEEAFQKLKEALARPPILIKPATETPVHLYFCVMERPISTVLTHEVDKNKKPIYFVSGLFKERR